MTVVVPHGATAAPPPVLSPDDFGQAMRRVTSESIEDTSFALATDVPLTESIGDEMPPDPQLLPKESLLERLEQAENRIRALESNQGPPYLNDSGQGPNGRFFQTLSSRWFNSGNPEIAIIGAQTYTATPASETKWYDRLAIRGYAQIRFDDVPYVAPGSAPPQYVEDGAIGEYQNFIIRRARLIVFGDVSDHMFVYFQTDFAATPPNSDNSTYFGQIRDLYADVYVDVTKIHRFRIGQSKLPYGWENLQSSSNRIPLDRDDALNSATRNQRDLGVFYYWTPERGQDTLKNIMDDGLKGSGNYGIFAFGIYNGQGGSSFEQNDNVHVVSRLTLPWQWENGQYTEIGVQGYTGKFCVPSAPINPLGIGPPIEPVNTLGTGDHVGQTDQRIALSGIYYPQPWGFQSEWNVGRGPSLDASQTAVVDRSLTGGYAMSMYKYDSNCWGTFWPFVRYQYYKGGFKYLDNAPYMHVNEWNIGCEWDPNPQMEFVSQYTFCNRTNTDAMDGPGEMSYQQFVGDLLRFQFQLNY